MKLSSYFDLGKKNTEEVPRIRKAKTNIDVPNQNNSAPKNTNNMPIIEQLLLYAGAVIGVLLSSTLLEYDGSTSLITGMSLSKFFISTIIALLIVPIAYDKLQLRTDVPLIYRISVFVQHGVFWQVLINSLGKTILS